MENHSTIVAQKNLNMVLINSTARFYVTFHIKLLLPKSAVRFSDHFQASLTHLCRPRCKIGMTLGPDQSVRATVTEMAWVYRRRFIDKVQVVTGAVQDLNVDRPSATA